ncbi:MAG TPA: hypothetical protein VG273_18770 [Bryobacteraceae bacterium]|nr:hypothetical protein [Bryobacteraceae bacterium]
MKRTENQSSEPDSKEDRDTLILLGGAAMVMVGAGLILSTPRVRRYLGSIQFASLLRTAIPDIERYLKLRFM